MRDQMVARLSQQGITHTEVLHAMSLIPRHFFLDETFDEMAYQERAFPIDSQQTISAPYTVAIQSQLLDPQPGNKVLEIGTGCGYQTAILCSLNLDVYSIERHQALHLSARDILSQTFHFAPHLYWGNGYHGIPEAAPFDKIIVTAASPDIPQVLVQQLALGGIMVVPVGTTQQRLCTVTKSTDGTIDVRQHQDCSFVPFVRD